MFLHWQWFAKWKHSPSWCARSRTLDIPRKCTFPGSVWSDLVTGRSLPCQWGKWQLAAHLGSSGRRMLFTGYATTHIQWTHCRCQGTSKWSFCWTGLVRPVSFESSFGNAWPFQMSHGPIKVITVYNLSEYCIQNVYHIVLYVFHMN